MLATAVALAVAAAAAALAGAAAPAAPASVQSPARWSTPMPVSGALEAFPDVALSPRRPGLVTWSRSGIRRGRVFGHLDGAVLSPAGSLAPVGRVTRRFAGASRVRHRRVIAAARAAAP